MGDLTFDQLAAHVEKLRTASGYRVVGRPDDLLRWRAFEAGLGVGPHDGLPTQASEHMPAGRLLVLKEMPGELFAWPVVVGFFDVAELPDSWGAK